MKRHGGLLPPAARPDAHAEKRGLVGDLQRGSRGRSFGQQRCRECGRAAVPPWIGFAPASDLQQYVGERQFMLLDDHDLQSVR